MHEGKTKRVYKKKSFPSHSPSPKDSTPMSKVFPKGRSGGKKRKKTLLSKGDVPFRIPAQEAEKGVSLSGEKRPCASKKKRTCRLSKSYLSHGQGRKKENHL